MCIYVYLREAVLLGGKKLDLVVPIVDGQDCGAEEKAAGLGASVGGHGKSVHVCVAPHHVWSSGEEGRTSGGNSLDLDDGTVCGVDPEGSLDHIGSFLPGGHGHGETVSAVELLHASRFKRHFIVG